jgi:alpha-galactosidase
MHDPDRYPSGIKALADYVHQKGLKFGICALPLPLPPAPSPTTHTGAHSSPNDAQVPSL